MRVVRIAESMIESNDMTLYIPMVSGKRVWQLRGWFRTHNGFIGIHTASTETAFENFQASSTGKGYGKGDRIASFA